MDSQLWLYSDIDAALELTSAIAVIPAKDAGIGAVSRVVTDLRYILEGELMRLGYSLVRLCVGWG